MSNRVANGRARFIVHHCLIELLANPKYMSGYGFKQKCYSKWAIKQMADDLARYPNIPPLTIIEEFRNQMDEFSCLNPHSSFQFSCAKDMAERVIDLLIN